MVRKINFLPQKLNLLVRKLNFLVKNLNYLSLNLTFCSKSCIFMHFSTIFTLFSYYPSWANRSEFGFSHFARHSLLFFLLSAIAPKTKVRSRAKSDWAISKSDVPSSALNALNSRKKEQFVTCNASRNWKCNVPFLLMLKTAEKCNRRYF